MPRGCLQTFASDPSSEVASKIAEECKSKVTSFKDMLPLISAICNQGLHERHWEKIAEVVGFEIRPDEVTSLRRLLDYGIQEYVKVIVSVSNPLPHANRLLGSMLHACAMVALHRLEPSHDFSSRACNMVLRI